MFSIPSNPIMDAIEKLYDISKDAAFAEATYCNNKNEVDLLKDFFTHVTTNNYKVLILNLL
jgi:peroxiredoxin